MLLTTPYAVGNICSVFTFKSGRVLKVFNQHRMFSIQKNKFEYMSKCVGDDAILEDGTYDTLLKHDIVEVN